MKGLAITLAIAVILAVTVLYRGGVPRGVTLPGAKPNEYKPGENVRVYVNSMSSVNTHLLFDYYTLPFCEPSAEATHGKDTFGEILLGVRTRASPYEHVFVGHNFGCKQVCSPKTINKQQQQKFERFIEEEYVMQMQMDGLPVAVKNPVTHLFTIGFPLGVKDNKQHYLNNHLHFHIKYVKVGGFEDEKPEDQQVRIVEFTVKPHSFKFPTDEESLKKVCTESFNADGADHFGLLSPQTDEQLVWTYGVEWEETTGKWGDRWEVYMNISDTEIHWFSIINSVMIAFFLSGILAAVMLRTLLRDIATYNAYEDADDLNEETGWKMVHSDVFRPPSNRGLLACLVGTGVQLLGMCFAVLILACLGFVSPTNTGTLFTWILLSYVFLGIYGGFTSARLMKMWGETSWWNVFLTATVVPGTVFAAFFFINLFVWQEESSGAVPFSAMCAVIALWFFFSVPQVFLGAVLGYKRDALKPPVRVNLIRRPIPEQRWCLQPWFTIMAGGVLPFGAVFIELFFILTSIWMHRHYYVFGFLLLVFIILCITCAEITIVMCYFQLCAEDHDWWWRSFFTSGSSGIYVFLYSVFYFFTSSVRITRFAGRLLFFGYMGVISYLFCIMTGTIGFMACFWFVRKIYSSIKVD